MTCPVQAACAGYHYVAGSTDNADLQRNLRKTENISFKEREILSIKRKKKKNPAKPGRHSDNF